MHLYDEEIWKKTSLLQTERLLIKELDVELWKHMYATLSDAELMEIMGIHAQEKLDIEKEKYNKGLTTYWISFKPFLLIEKNTGKTIGRTGFHNWYALHRRAELGYLMEYEDYKNKGLMTEAVAAIIDYGFSCMDLNRIEAFISPANIPSIRLVEKLGFTREGVLRDHFYKNNVYEDSACYSLLKGEYDELKRKGS